jgi:transposase
MEGLKPKNRRATMQKNPMIKPKAATKMTEGELIDEIEYLRAENAVLKKFDTLHQKKRLKTKKKRNFFLNS